MHQLILLSLERRKTFAGLHAQRKKSLAFRVLLRISEFNHPESCPRALRVPRSALLWFWYRTVHSRHGFSTHACKGYKGPIENVVPPEQRCKEAGFLRREVKLLNPGVGCYFWSQEMQNCP